MLSIKSFSLFFYYFFVVSETLVQQADDGRATSTAEHKLLPADRFNFVEYEDRIESNSKKSFRCDYTYFEEAEGYLKFQEIAANFEEARLRCHLEGSILASPVNIGLKSAIRKLLKQNGVATNILTGIHATFSSGDFCSIEGVPLSKIPHEWSPGERHTYKNAANCIILMPKGKMSVVSCRIPFPYACYKKGNNQELQLNACGTSDNEYQLDSRTGSCYKFHRIPRTWSRAYMTCAAEGGHLVILNSETEAVVVRELFAKNPENVIKGNGWKNMAFVGFHDWNEHGEFLTIHGQTLQEAGYDKFSPGQPDNTTSGQFCGAVFRTALLDDLWCETRYAFICEKNPADACP